MKHQWNRSLALRALPYRSAGFSGVLHTLLHVRLARSLVKGHGRMEGTWDSFAKEEIDSIEESSSAFQGTISRMSSSSSIDEMKR